MAIDKDVSRYMHFKSRKFGQDTDIFPLMTTLVKIHFCQYLIFDIWPGCVSTQYPPVWKILFPSAEYCHLDRVLCTQPYLSLPFFKFQ